MRKRKQYKSEAFAAIHETMDALHQIEAINKKTMRDFDAACLADLPEMEPEEIRALREREHVSQPIFAAYLNVTRNLVSDWERGVRRPGGTALRLLSIVEKRGLDSLT
ncbi:MAG: DNA-binding transcriptional regulator [Candidatus Competibacteraceae bacterium]|jgi:putative transcriptional regulator